MHISARGRYNILVLGLMEADGQLRPPLAIGHNRFASSAFGIAIGLIVLSPVIGSIAITMF